MATRRKKFSERRKFVPKAAPAAKAPAPKAQPAAAPVPKAQPAAAPLPKARPATPPKARPVKTPPAQPVADVVKQQEQRREGGVGRHFDEELEYNQGLRIIRKLAEGGMGTVYLAEQIGTAGFNKTVAVKVIKREWLKDKRALGAFVGEARLVADLVHANICQVYSLNRHHGQHFIVMEYLHGLGLNTFLTAHKNGGVLPPSEYSAFIASRVTRGLEYAHTKKARNGQPLGVVHRDVTPSNVILDFRGFVKLTDFGIALAVTSEGMDQPGVVTGKICYMSPEQARAEPVDYRSDIYSLGLLLYELLTGQKVYTARSVAEVREQMKRRIRPPRELNENVPGDLSKICMKALQYDPLDRFQSARDFGNSLEYFMYHDKWGPTNEKLALYLQKVFPDIERDKIV
jgi:eukaryotic-like serine/threonine-protein kinase